MALGFTHKADRDDKENPGPAWAAWVVPSIADLIFVAILGLLSLSAASTRLLGDAGICWHIRTGQIILQTQTIPYADPFSSSRAGQVWFAWEWLYDVLVGALDNVSGLNGIVVLTALVVALTFAWTFILLIRRGTNFMVALILVLLAVSASTIHLLARPHVFTWLFTVLWFYLLESVEERAQLQSKIHRQYFWVFPLLMVLWVNLHGGFILGFALLGIYWLSAAWDYIHLRHGERNGSFDDVLEKIRAGKRVRYLSLAALFTATATLCNPYGWRLHIHVYRYLTDRFLMNHIDEFQSPNFHEVAPKCFAILLLLSLFALATFALATKSIGANSFRFRSGFILLFAVYAGLYSSRNIPMSSLLLILMIGPTISQAILKLVPRSQDGSTSFFTRMQNVESTRRGHLWPAAAALLTCWVALHHGHIGGEQFMNAHFDPRKFPVAATDYLAKENLPGPIFSPDSWGGYFIYRLYPQTKVVMDDRHDFYGDDFVKAYIRTMQVEPGWRDFIRQQKPRCIVAPRDSPLASILLETPNWRSIYDDEVARIFTPTGVDGEELTPRSQLPSH